MRDMRFQPGSDVPNMPSAHLVPFAEPGSETTRGLVRCQQISAPTTPAPTHLRVSKSNSITRLVLQLNEHWIDQLCGRDNLCSVKHNIARPTRPSPPCAENRRSTFRSRVWSSA